MNSRTRTRDSPLYSVGTTGVWTVSSFKPGNGIENIIDENPHTYWQSEGPQPHIITVQLPRCKRIVCVDFLADSNADDSYTPHRISVWVGNNKRELIEIVRSEFQELCSWERIRLDSRSADEPLAIQYVMPTTHASLAPKAFVVQMRILANRLSGKDSHLRGMRVLVADEDPLSF